MLFFLVVVVWRQPRPPFVLGEPVLVFNYCGDVGAKYFAA